MLYILRILNVITCADDGSLICAFRTPFVYFYRIPAPLHQLGMSSESVHCILACIHLRMYDHINIALYNFNQ